MSAASENGSLRALVIGIDRYPQLPAQLSLEGCVNDARLMASVLVETFGFAKENVRVLLNEDASREAILGALGELVEATRPGDVVMVHYSGHGSQMTDREGDEPDGMDETIMPSDSGRYGKPNRDITDDEIRLWLESLAERDPGNITIVFDCCHSGTGTRDALAMKAREAPPDTRPVEELPPSPIPPEKRAGLTRGSRDVGPSAWLPLSDRYVLIAGCKDDERSYEHHRQVGDRTIPHGALTYYLTQALQKAPPDATYRDVFDLVAGQVTAANRQQHPQMEGTVDRKLFGLEDLRPEHHVRVSGRDRDRVTLAGGEAHGLVTGSRWEIHRPGTKVPSTDTRIGEVEIERVDVVTSEARITNEIEAGAIGENGRAVVVEFAYGDLRLPVILGSVWNGAVSDQPPEDPASAESWKKLSERLAASELVRVVPDGDAASAIVYLVGPRGEPGDGAPAARLGPVESPTWAVVSEAGELELPPKKPGQEAEIVANLERLARYRRAMELDNPDPDCPLRPKVRCQLYRRGPGDDWAPAPAGEGGLPVFQDDDEIALEVESLHDQPLYLNLLDFGLTGKITHLYPPTGAKEWLAPRTKVRIGGRGEFPLGMPDSFPFVPNHWVKPRQDGVETFKLMVTTREADFSFLEEAEGYRGAEAAGPGSPLDLLLRAATGPATRDVKKKTVEVGDDWCAVSKPFVMRRRS